MKETIERVNPGSEFYIKEGCHIIELSNTPDDPDTSIAKVRVAPGVTTRWHRLDGITERYVILEGRGRMEAGSLPAQEVGTFDTVRIPPACPQRITNTGRGDLVFLAICTPRFIPEAYVDIDSTPLA